MTTTSPFAFEEATKDQAKARIALDGPSGSGKTWTALTWATAFGGDFAVVDTERGSASKYAGPFKFKRLNLTRYDPGDIPAIFATAAAQGFETVVVDSLSRFWSGVGGMLERVDNAGKRRGGGNQFAGWKEERPIEAAMIEAMLGYPGHVIVTMRVKTAYEVTTDDRGRKVPVKIGLTPEQRAGIEYEFDVVGDMDLENTLTISKTRCPALSQAVIRRPGPEVADTILEWLTDGVEVVDAMGYRDLVLQEDDPNLLRELYREVRDRGLGGAAVPSGTGEPTTLRELIIQRGKDVAPVRPPADLPRNANGAIARSQATDPELEAAGLMTGDQLKEHTALGGGHPGEHKTPKPDRKRVSRSKGDPDDGEPDGDPPPPEIAPENKPGSISPTIRANVQALFSRWFAPDERDQRLSTAEQVLGRELTGPKDGRSFSNLTLAEGHKLLDTLGEVKTREDLIERLTSGAAAQVGAP